MIVHLFFLASAFSASSTAGGMPRETGSDAGGNSSLPAPGPDDSSEGAASDGALPPPAGSPFLSTLPLSLFPFAAAGLEASSNAPGPGFVSAPSPLFFKAADPPVLSASFKGAPAFIAVRVATAP